jgi:hypothetical protein
MTLRRFPIQITFQGIRTAGASLVNQDYISLFPDRSKYSSVKGDIVCCWLTWTTCQDEQGGRFRTLGFSG